MIVFVSSFVEWTCITCNREMIHLKTIKFGVRPVDSLEVYFSGTSLLLLLTCLQHRMSKLPEVAPCVALVTSIDPIHIKNVVSMLVCISSFVKCAAFIAPSPIFFAIYSYKSQNLWAHNKTPRLQSLGSASLCSIQTREAQMQYFNARWLSSRLST